MTSDRLKTLGRYEILQELGRGAMGVVYLARDPIIGRQVALKVLRVPAMAGEDEQEQFRRRFIREAQSAGILAHPNIVTIHDVAEGEDGQPTFIAMEHIQGTDLKELLRPGKPLDLAFVRDVVRQIAQGLEFAHSQGVVHRDVKPANVLITGEGQVKITDFGIARIDTSNLTQDTQLLGTPNYMAPEQIQGTDTDHRVDIFALGVMVYEMTTGQKPFQGENVTEVTHRIVYEDHRAATERVPELPEGLDEVLMRALAKKPEDRHQRAGDLSEDLDTAIRAAQNRENLNATQVVEPLPPKAEGSSGATGWEDLSGSLEEVWQGLKSPRGLALGVAVALLIALGIGGAALWMWMGDRPVVEESLQEPSSDPRVADLVREGHRLLANGDPQSALETFRDAERLAPDQEDVRTWRELAERQAETFERWSERERQLGRRLAAGQLALTDGRFQEALSEVEAALELADDEESVALAEEIRRLADEGMREREERRRQAASRRAAEEESRRLQEQEVAEKKVATAATAGPLRPAEPVEAPPPVRAGDSTLEMEFISDQPQGTLTIFVGEDRFLNETFRFIEKKGFLGLGGEAYRGRLYLEPQVVPTGSHTVRVYVTPRGQAALAKILDAVEFAPGDHHRLEIQLTEAGGVTARLR